MSEPPLRLPYPPSANAYWRSVNGRVLVSAEARAYKQKVGWLCAVGRKLKPLDGPVVVTIAAYRPRRIGDLDNLLKVLLDSIRGYAYRDDSQVVEIHARRADDKADPRVEIRVEAVTG